MLISSAQTRMNPEIVKMLESCTSPALDEIEAEIVRIRAERAKLSNNPNKCPKCQVREVRIVFRRWDGCDVACDCGYEAYWD